MDDSLIDSGLVVRCETCECEIDFPDDRAAELAAEIGICRQCGMAFLVDAAPGAGATKLSG